MRALTITPLIAIASAAVAITAARADAAAGDVGPVVVVPVDVARDGGQGAIAAAAAMRGTLDKMSMAGGRLIGADAVKALIVERLDRGGTPVATYLSQLEQADAALGAMDDAKSLQILETLIRDLVADPEFSREKHELLQRARLKRAARLVALAGSKETGSGGTENGRKARGILADVLRANPKLTLSRDEYPPRFFALLDLARADLAAIGTGGLHIESKPAGALVYAEGLELGRTPLHLGNDVLTKGKYRVWIEAGGARSVPQSVDVGPVVTPIKIDLAFEGALWPEGPGIRPLAGTALDAETARTIGAFFGADTLLLVGVGGAGAGTEVWGAAFSVRQVALVRHGVVRVGGDNAGATSVDAAAAALAQFLVTGEKGAAVDDVAALPPSILPPANAGPGVGGVMNSGPTVSAVSSGSADGDVPWLLIGGVSAGVLVATAATAAVLLLLPRQGEFTVTITETQ